MERDLVSLHRALLVAALALAACWMLPAIATATPLGPSPTTLSFSQETVGKTSASQSVFVSNPSAGTGRILAVSIGGANPGDFAISGESCAGATLEELESCLVEISFAPQAGGARSATLEVALEGEPTIEVGLSGTGQTRRLTVPAAANFSLTSVGSPTTQQVPLKNESEAGVNVNEVQIEGADPGDFGIEGSNCNGYIGPGMGCVLTVRFTPSASGGREAQLRVSTDGTPSEAFTELSGEGATPELAFEPSSYDFGLVEVHAGGERANFTLRNTGAAAVQLSNLEISGPDASEFWIPGSDCWGGTLASGQSCSLEVQFNANEEGSFAAAVRVNAGSLSFQAPLSARAERPQILASPALLAFGPTAVGSSQTRTVTLTNVGHLPVAFFIAVVSGGDVSSFHLLEESCTSNLFAGRPHTIEPGESCVATIRFEPTGAGAKAATASFFGNGEGALQVPLEGSAVAAHVSLSPSSHDFGAVAAGDAGPVQVFQLRNESADPYAIEAAILAGADLGDFSVRADSCSEAVLDPGSACTVAVRFSPDSAGPKTATLRLRGGGGTTVAQLSGKGTAAPPATMVGASANAVGGRVLPRFDSRLRPAAGGKVAAGRVRCQSSEACVIRVGGLVSGQLATPSGSRPGIRAIIASRIRLAAGASAAITVALPPAFRGSSEARSWEISLRWRTGSWRGVSSHHFRF